MADFFPGFERRRIATFGAEINPVTGGSGPPLLLLLSYPQLHVIWRTIAGLFSNDLVGKGAPQWLGGRLADSRSAGASG
jgi:hypothetical protein